MILDVMFPFFGSWGSDLPGRNLMFMLGLSKVRLRISTSSQ